LVWCFGNEEVVDFCFGDGFVVIGLNGCDGIEGGQRSLWAGGSVLNLGFGDGEVI
jgi:hypothetical protein